MTLNDMYKRMISAMGVRGLEIPMTAVKFFKQDDDLPQVVTDNCPTDISLTSCQAMKQASLGDAVSLTKENVGCVAAAISLGLVDQNQDTPLGESKVYTDIMRDQSHMGERFIPPSPRDFTDGTVYACSQSGRKDFCLFGEEDSGRFPTVEIAQKAISEMTAIQPAVMKAVFLYSRDTEGVDFPPDVVAMNVRPVELTRIVSAYQFKTGERVTASMGAVRVVNSDLIVRPYLTRKINVSTFCVGARLIARYEADRLGIGMPYKDFEIIVDGMEDSKTGHPFHLFPGAAD